MAQPSSELLPHAEEKDPELYEKDKGSAQIHGQIFEYKFCALSFLRAKNKGYKFKLASNKKGLGAFDDVVVEYCDDNSSKRHIFLQLKSKAKRQVTLSELKSKNGDFSLRKYYDSYIQVEENFNCSEEGVKMDGRIEESLFIIYTNTDVAHYLESKKVTHMDEEEFLMTGGSVLQFNEEEHKAIYEHLQELPKHREFLSRLRIFYSQADEINMDSHIKPELQQNMKLPESELDLTYMCFIEFVKDWWKDSNYTYYLKETNSKEYDPLEKTKEKVRTTLEKTKEKVRTTLVAKILDQRKSELDDLRIKYKEKAITGMKELIDPHKTVLIFAPGRSTTLTAAKIHQMLSARKHIIVNLQQLVRYKTEVMLAWKNQFDVLVLESKSSTENLQDVLNEISIILNECGEEKKFRFIANRMGNTEQISALRRTFSTKLKEEYDDWKFSDIITDSTTFLLDKKVTFQGNEMQIKDLVKESDFRMLNALDCDSLSLLLANEKPSIGTPTENTLEYYIDRTLERVRNSKSGFQTEDETMVNFRKKNLEELQDTRDYREDKCNVSDYGEGMTQLSLANEDEKGRKKQCSGNCSSHNLCKKYQKPLRRKNTDEFSNMQQGSQRKSSKVWRPSTLLDGGDRIILVTDDPGMGKSTLLTHLAKQTRNLRPDVWIVRVNINNYTSILQGIKANGFEEKAVIKLLTEAAQIKETEGAQLEKQLFNYIYNSTGNMVVLIDGVDEVSPLYAEEVIQILRFLSKTQIRKLWVTSRNSVKDQLEQECQCQPYTLVPFSVDDQTSFLVKFWNQEFSDMEADYLKNLARQVVELSSKYLSVRETNFMGIPLQSMLLAEIFEENLKQCSTSRTVELPVYINIVMLYDFYVKKKWKIYLSEKKKSDQTNVNVRTDDDALFDIFMDNHKAAALKAILSTHHLEKLSDKDVLKKGEDFLQKIQKGLEKTGIITGIIEGLPVFLHRTFAEYFVAKRLCDNTKDSQVFMRDHLFEPRFSVVRSMVDRILAKECPLHEAVLNSSIVARHLRNSKSITQKDGGGRTLLHVAISCRSPELVRQLLEYGADISSVDTLLDLSPVQYAMKMADWEMLSLLMEKKPEIRKEVLNGMYDVCTEHEVSVLLAAAKYGHTDLLKCLISTNNCENMPLPVDKGTLLQEAARGNHIRTVKTLVDLGANCDIQDANGKTALHVSAETGSLEVTKFIVERHEKVHGDTAMKYNVTLDRAIIKLNRMKVPDKDGNTPLHLAAAAGNTRIVHYLLSADSDFRSFNTRGEYPLTLAARYGRIDTVKLLLQSCSAVKDEEIMNSALTAAIVAGHVDTTELLLSSGAPVNGGENEKPIHTASRMGHEDIVQLILQRGASLSCTYNGNTALHLASEYGHLSLVTYFVELQRDGLYSPNAENETPLHLAARYGMDDIVKYFAENGFNINAASANGATCLHVACENGHDRTVECLLKYGAEVNSINSAEQTPLHIAAGRGQRQIVELLYLHKANISLRDKDGMTALLAASIKGHQDTVLFILQHGGSIEDTDGKGNSIAHFAVAKENYDILNFLSQHKVNLDVRNSDGDTPLLQAVREERSKMVQYLAEKNSDINTQGNDGMLPLDVAVIKGNLKITRLLLERNARSGKSGMDIVAAAQFGLVDILQCFLDLGSDINVKGNNGESPLHAACKSGQVVTVQYLSERGALLDLQDNNGNTALHVVVSNGHLDVTRVLVEKGANLSAADASGSTALHIAAKGGYLNIVQYLADSFAPIDMRNANNETALLVAAAEGHDKIVIVLIEQGAGIGVRDIEGKTALDIATEKGYTTIRQLLRDRAEGRKLVCSSSHIVQQTDPTGGNFEHLQKVVNAELSIDKATEKNDSDTTRMIKTRAEATLEISNPRSALYTAAENDNFEQVERLVKAGIALDYGDTFGRTALWHAASRGHKSIIRLLLANGSCTNIPDSEGMKPIEIAAREVHWDVVDEILEHEPIIGPECTEYLRSQLFKASESGEPEIVRIIVKCGISVNTTNEDGYTPLHVAAKYGQIEISRALLKSGANVNIADSRGKTPLTLAAEKGHVEILRNLLSDKSYFIDFKTVSSAALRGQVEGIREVLKNGGSVDTRSGKGLTSLTAEASKEEVIPIMLNYGESVDTADEEGSTPLYVAALNGHVEVVRELLKHGASLENANNNSCTPLNTAASNGHVQVVLELLNHGARVESANNNSWTPLNTAASNGHVEIVLELLKHGAKVESANKDGCTPLNTAALNGHVEVVRELLKFGAKMDISNNDGSTPLNTAASKGHVDVVQELLKNGGSVDSVDNNSWTPLNTAALNGHVDVVRQLLKHGAIVERKNNNGWTPLYTAALNGHVDVVQELLKNGGSVDSVDNNGCTPLNAAALNGHVDVVRDLLKHGATVDSADKNGSTPLNTAATNGQVEVVQELLKHGANVKIVNNNGCTPLNTSATRGHVDVVRVLLKHGANLESEKNNGCLLLNAAASNGDVEVVRELLKHGVEVESANTDGCTPLYTAALNGHAEVVRELLKYGARVESANNNGSTPLHTAASKGHVDVVRELLEHGASVNSRDNNGCTPLNTAADEGHAEIIRELLEHGAKVEIENNYGCTPLNTAALNGHVDVARELLKHGAQVENAKQYGNTPLYTAALNGHVGIVRELLKHGAKVGSARTNTLYIAALNGHVEVVRELLQHGAKVESATDEGWTPLNAAALNGKVDVIRELLKHGALVDSKNKNGSTPLNTAASGGHVEVVRELLKHGASVKTVNNDGCTPLNTAGAKGHADVVRELQKYDASVDSA